MANITETAKWEEHIYLIDPNDPVVGGPDGIDNIQPTQLANRTKWLKEQLEVAQQDLETVGTDGQNALWAGLERALSDLGLLATELDRDHTVRHQEGEFVLINRGVKNGCDLTKSAIATRNLDVSAGVCFMHGRELPVHEGVNAASVPSNSGSSARTALAYLYTQGSVVRLGVTGLDESAPTDALVLASLSIPGGSTDNTAPHLEDVTITSVVRKETDWPLIQESPAFVQEDFKKVMGANKYQLSLDVLNYEGGESPHLVKHEADRATNTFRVYLGGSADSVRVRYVAHLMSQ